MIHNGNLTITKENENDFKDLKEVTGNLYVYGSAKLNALTTVGGNLYVNGSAKLDALTTVGGDLYVNVSANLDAMDKMREALEFYSSQIVPKIELYTTPIFLEDGKNKIGHRASQTLKEVFGNE